MCDCEMPSCCVVSQPSARKRHRCCECRGWIEAGEKYELISGVWDGRGDSFKTCLQCSRLREKIHKLTKCCVPLGMMRDEIAELDEYHGTTENQQEIWAEHNAIRIQRGAAISPAFKADENTLAD